MISKSNALSSDLCMRESVLGAFIGSNMAAKNPYILVKFGLVGVPSEVIAAAADAAATVAALVAESAWEVASGKLSAERSG